MSRFVFHVSPRDRRHRRVRARIAGTADRPRLSVFRSAQHLTAQLIDDAAGKTLAAASDRECAAERLKAGAEMNRKVALAREVGKMLAERAKARGITVVVFDRGGYAYHGRVKAVAEGAREGGLKF